MLKKVKKIAGGVVLIIHFFSGGFSVGYFYCQSGKPVEIERMPVVSNIIKKDVEKMPVSELKTEVKCLYTGQFILDIQPLNSPGKFILNSALCGRIASREIFIPVAESGNFKLYLGIGIGLGTACFVGYGIYKLVK